MDNTIDFASGLVPIYTPSVNCFNKTKKFKKICKVKLSSLILSKGTGKTHLKHHLQSLDNELVIIDMNEAIKDSDDELDFLKKGRNYILDLLKQFPKKRFLLLLDTKDQSDYFEVPDENSFLITPSLKLFNLILGNISDKNKKLEVEKARLKLIKDTDADKLNIFETFDSLYQIIKRIYNLQSNF